jgi:flagellar basal-body rod protein FlgB
VARGLLNSLQIFTIMTVQPAHDSLRFGEAALRLRSLRQEMLTGNLVNADTPGYKARDIDFASELSRALSGGAGQGGLGLSTTHSGHLPGRASQTGGIKPLYRIPVQPAIDGNTVDPDLERGHFVKNSFFTESAISFLGSSLRSRLSAITGQPS